MTPTPACSAKRNKGAGFAAQVTVVQQPGMSAAGLTRRTLAAALLSAGALAGCGFQLRGNQQFNFSSIAVTPSTGSAVAQELRQALATLVQVMPADAPVNTAQVLLQVVSEVREKVVVGINSSGQVRELQLRLRVRFRLTTPADQAQLAGDEIVQQRDISYNETAALAKETEEALLYRDMQTDIVQQILRRLGAVRLVL